MVQPGQKTPTAERVAPALVFRAGSLLCALRRIGLAKTNLARASSNTIRLKLFKIGALVSISVRRVKLAMNSACPFQREWALAYARLAAAAR